MISINLIPLQRLEARHRRRRIRAWTTAISIYAVLLIAGSAAVHIFWDKTERELSQELATIDRKLTDLNRQLQAIHPELTEATIQLDASRAVAVQPDWSVLLALLSRLRGENIVLERCALIPETVLPESRPAPVSVPTTPVTATSAGPARTARSVRKAMNVRLEIKGLGRTHQDVSRFVLSLEETGLFNEVKLMETLRQSFRTEHAISFRVNCSMRENHEVPR